MPNCRRIVFQTPDSQIIGIWRRIAQLDINRVRTKPSQGSGHGRLKGLDKAVSRESEANRMKKVQTWSYQRHPKTAVSRGSRHGDASRILHGLYHSYDS